MRASMRRALNVFLFFLAVALVGPVPLGAGEVPLRVGTDAAYPPYVLRGPSGLAGFDVDLVEALAARIGRELVWIDRPFAGLIGALVEGEIDLIASGMSATEERARKVAFTEAYEISRSTFVVPAGWPPLCSPDDLKGRRVAVIAGTVQEAYVATLEGLDVSSRPTTDDCFDALLSGEADATLVDRPVAVSMAGREPFVGKIALALDWEIPGSAKALALRRDDGELLEALNGALADLKAEGVLIRLRDKWMAFRL